MQPNNKIRPFSTNTDNKYSDSDVGTLPVIGTGAVNGARADSKLYNSLSANTSLVACALADLIASQNQSITFGQETPIDTWLQAVKDTFATTLVVNSIIGGTTSAGNATNVTTKINGKPISSIFESDGTTVKNATNSQSSTKAKTIEFTTQIPTQSPPEGTLLIYYGTTLPSSSQRFDRILYLIGG